jgi:hypothetical protein
MDDVAISVPQIYATIENRQADHQDLVVEVEGILSNHSNSILIDHGSNLSYIALQVVEACVLQRIKHAKSW